MPIQATRRKLRPAYWALASSHACRGRTNSRQQPSWRRWSASGGGRVRNPVSAGRRVRSRTFLRSAAIAEQPRGSLISTMLSALPRSASVPSIRPSPRPNADAAERKILAAGHEGESSAETADWKAEIVDRQRLNFAAYPACAGKDPTGVPERSADRRPSTCLKT
jgi:hypothetical protein